MKIPMFKLGAGRRAGQGKRGAQLAFLGLEALEGRKLLSRGAGILPGVVVDVAHTDDHGRRGRGRDDAATDDRGTSRRENELRHGADDALTGRVDDQAGQRDPNTVDDGASHNSSDDHGGQHTVSDDRVRHDTGETTAQGNRQSSEVQPADDHGGSQPGSGRRGRGADDRGGAQANVQRRGGANAGAHREARSTRVPRGPRGHLNEHGANHP